MKITKEKFREHHDAILAAASRLFRERGFENVTVAEITRAAGLTHGGFYNHFESKEDLLAESVRSALDASAQHLLGPDGTYLERADFIRGYLSEGHLSNRAEGCPVVALGPDASLTKSARTAFAAGLRRYLNSAAKLTEAGQPTDRSTALATLAGLAGAMLMARAVQGEDDSLAMEILQVTRESLVA